MGFNPFVIKPLNYITLDYSWSIAMRIFVDYIALIHVISRPNNYSRPI